MDRQTIVLILIAVVLIPVALFTVRFIKRVFFAPEEDIVGDAYNTFLRHLTIEDPVLAKMIREMSIDEAYETLREPWEIQFNPRVKRDITLADKVGLMRRAAATIYKTTM